MALSGFDTIQLTLQTIGAAAATFQAVAAWRSQPDGLNVEELQRSARNLGAILEAEGPGLEKSMEAADAWDVLKGRFGSEREARELAETVLNNVRDCLRDTNDVFQQPDKYTPREMDMAATATAACVCRWLRRLRDSLGGQLPKGRLTSYWSQYGCESTA